MTFKYTKYMTFKYTKYMFEQLCESYKNNYTEQDISYKNCFAKGYLS